MEEKSEECVILTKKEIGLNEEFFIEKAESFFSNFEKNERKEDLKANKENYSYNENVLNNKEEKDLNNKEAKDLNNKEEKDLNNKEEKDLNNKEENDLNNKEEKDLNNKEEKDLNNKKEKDLNNKEEKDLNNKEEKDLNNKEEKDLNNKEEKDLNNKEEKDLNNKEEKDLNNKEEKDLNNKEEKDLNNKEEKDLNNKEEKDLNNKEEKDLNNKEEKDLNNKEEKDLNNKEEKDLNNKKEKDLNNKEEKDLNNKEEKDLNNKEEKDLILKEDKKEVQEIVENDKNLKNRKIADHEENKSMILEEEKHGHKKYLNGSLIDINKEDEDEEKHDKKEGLIKEEGHSFENSNKEKKIDVNELNDKENNNNKNKEDQEVLCGFTERSVEFEEKNQERKANQSKEERIFEFDEEVECILIEEEENEKAKKEKQSYFESCIPKESKKNVRSSVRLQGQKQIKSTHERGKKRKRSTIEKREQVEKAEEVLSKESTKMICKSTSSFSQGDNHKQEKEKIKLQEWTKELLLDVENKISAFSNFSSECLLDDLESCFRLKNKMLRYLPSHFFQDKSLTNEENNEHESISKIKEQGENENDNNTNTLCLNKTNIGIIENEIPIELKNYLRVICEGSFDNLNLLVKKVRNILIENKFETQRIYLSSNKLKKILPIALDRIMIGISSNREMNKSKYEDTTVSCMWTWQNKTYEFFPDELKNKAKANKEVRNSLSKLIKALYKLRSTIYQCNEQQIHKMHDYVNQLTKKYLDEKEKQMRLEERRKQINDRRIAKEQEKKAKHDEKRRKDEEKRKEKEKEELMQAKDADKKAKDEEKRIKEEPKKGKRYEDQEKQKIDEGKRSKEMKEMQNQQNVMMTWLKKNQEKLQDKELSIDELLGFNTSLQREKVIENTKSEANTTIELKHEETKEDENSHKIAKNLDLSIILDRKLLLHEDEWNFLTKSLPNEKKIEWIYLLQESAKFKKSVLPKDELLPIDWIDYPENLTKTSQELFEDFKEKLGKPHFDIIKRQIYFYLINRQFYNELPSLELNGKTNIIQKSPDEVRKNLTLTHYCNEGFVNCSPFLRTVCFYDSEWKRPPRKLLMNNLPNQIDALHPFEEEAEIDYDLDSDDEWFELYDVEDLSEDKKEEEDEDLLDEEEEEESWLVPDYIIDDEDATRINYSSLLVYNSDNNNNLNVNSLQNFSIKFESVFESWLFFFEGEPKQNSFISENESDMINYVTEWSSVYGTLDTSFGLSMLEKLYMLYDESSSQRKELNSEDIIQLAKFCHGKAKSYKKLIEEYRRLNPHLAKAFIERNFRSHLSYEKRTDGKKWRWYVTENAAIEYNLQEELENILKKRLSEAYGDDNDTEDINNSAYNANSINSNNNESSKDIVEGKEEANDSNVESAIVGFDKEKKKKIELKEGILRKGESEGKEVSFYSKAKDEKFKAKKNNQSLKKMTDGIDEVEVIQDINDCYDNEEESFVIPFSSATNKGFYEIKQSISSNSANCSFSSSSQSYFDFSTLPHNFFFGAEIIKENNGAFNTDEQEEFKKESRIKDIEKKKRMEKGKGKFESFITKDEETEENCEKEKLEKMARKKRVLNTVEEIEDDKENQKDKEEVKDQFIENIDVEVEETNKKNRYKSVAPLGNDRIQEENQDKKNLKKVSVMLNEDSNGLEFDIDNDHIKKKHHALKLERKDEDNDLILPTIHEQNVAHGENNENLQEQRKPKVNDYTKENLNVNNVSENFKINSVKPSILSKSSPFLNSSLCKNEMSEIHDSSQNLRNEMCDTEHLDNCNSNSSHFSSCNGEGKEFTAYASENFFLNKKGKRRSSQMSPNSSAPRNLLITEFFRKQNNRNLTMQ